MSRSGRLDRFPDIEKKLAVSSTRQTRLLEPGVTPESGFFYAVGEPECCMYNFLAAF